MTMSDNYEYDLAVSFAGEDRIFVEAVVEACKLRGFKVFYYHDVVNAWLGKDFLREQRRIYGEGTRYFVPFISKHYLSKPITTDEFRTALSTDVQKFGGYILPLKMDDTKIPADLLLPSTEYIRVDGKSPEAVADILHERVHGLPSSSTPLQIPSKDDDVLSGFKKPKPLATNFNSYKAGQEVLAYFQTVLLTRIGSLEEAGYAATLMTPDGMLALRIETGNQTIYALDAWQGVMGNDKALGFNEGFGRHTMSKSSMTATATPVPGDKSGDVLLQVTNLSLLPHIGTESLLTKEAFLEAIWNKIMERLDRSHKAMS